MDLNATLEEQQSALRLNNIRKNAVVIANISEIVTGVIYNLIHTEQNKDFVESNLNMVTLNNLVANELKQVFLKDQGC